MKTFEVQCRLGILGYLGAGKQDGVFGDVTAYAVKEFQKDYGLAVDGIVGHITEKMLIDAVAGTATKKQSDKQAESDDKQTNPQAGTFWDEIRHFTRTEKNIRCPCYRCKGKEEDPEKRLMLEADHIRDIAGKPMVPSSVRRCQEHNDELDGSAPNSYHVRGLAMDFDIPALADSQIKAILAAEKAAGRIRYWYQMTSGWFHFDVN